MRKIFLNICILGIISVLLLFTLYKYNIAPHIALLISIFILSCYGILNKYSWKELEKSMFEGIFQAIEPIFMIALIGMLIGIWMMSGTVPTILYYGLKYISPKWFYINCVLITILCSTFIGSSVTTVSTIGVALIGIAKVLNLPLDISAGAIICGSCFGDKCSPLSETTNLAPAIANVNLFTHVKYLIWTTIPSIVITLFIFSFLGFTSSNHIINDFKQYNDIINKNFNITLFTLISPFLVFFLAAKKFPIIPTFVFGIISGILTIIIFQAKFNLKELASVMQNGFFLKDTSNSLISSLLNKGGLQSTMGAISMISIALAFGGLLKKLKILDSIIENFFGNLKTKGPITLLVSFTCILVNFLSGEQLLSIILPGKTFKKMYIKNNIPLKNLSRTLEDCGTLINPLIPWGVCGVLFSSALGVNVKAYLPYTFFLYLSPIFTIIFGYLDKKN